MAEFLSLGFYIGRYALNPRLRKQLGPNCGCAEFRDLGAHGGPSDALEGRYGGVAVAVHGADISV